ncbi:DUF2490 domain-containing protein [Mucilaginibacter sp. RS28]|uniref:DUF2490 domain-containing protein n=1 Tax=Mucilaginibacter straminoryzae TaxID=2932774 RepID=A0A9X2B7N3_9SPHI|nr:DUF2490 domain-containing protein [Mucilaginibacter straminoryzae]MCJ8208769.1 DUF2490 domain-containing protein [Mucilaginibacter straminoryzae]
MRFRIGVALLLAFFCIKSSFAQVNEFSGWGAWFHNQKFSQHWGAVLDIQMRSADEFKYLKHPLLRPGVSYYFANNKFATIGYLFTGTHRKTATESTFRTEHRTWEQFIYNHKIKAAPMMHRFRLEQRYVGSLGNSEAYFAQRFRYFARAVVPFNNPKPEFVKGPFLGLQNEVFLNVQNKDKVNKSTFDQNRAYLSVGYRLSKMIDVETGYLNQYINQVETNTMNHVIQLALYTRFGK